MIKVKDIMTKTSYRFTPDDDIFRVIEMFYELNLEGGLVFRNDELDGLFTEKDLIKGVALKKKKLKDIYQKVEIAREKLQIGPISIQVYQENNNPDINARIAIHQDDAIILFSGSIIEQLSDEELLSVIGYELAHIQLWKAENSEMEIVDRIISSIGNSFNLYDTYDETARRFNLYKEIYCDLGAYTVTNDIAPVITALVKCSTGLKNVSAESYLRQIKDILDKDPELKSEGLTHPENYVRAYALEQKSILGDQFQLPEKLIAGTSTIDNLDVFDQQIKHKQTLELLNYIMQAKWMQTDLFLSHVKLFNPEFKVKETDEIEIENYKNAHTSIKDYLSYLLLDFILLDFNNEELARGWIFQVADNLGVDAELKNIVKKELKLSDKQFKNLYHESVKTLQKIQTKSA